MEPGKLQGEQLLWVILMASHMALVVKNPPANAGDIRAAGSIPGLGRSPGGGNGNPLPYSCLGNPMDRGAWQAAAHRVTKNWTQLSNIALMGDSDALSNAKTSNIDQQ